LPDNFLLHSPQLFSVIEVENLLGVDTKLIFEGPTFLLSKRLLNGFDIRFIIGDVARCERGEHAERESCSSDDKLSNPITLPRYLLFYHILL
jgi:hypothetical protein